MTLALAKRVGDLDALSVHPSCLEFAVGDSKVVLHPNAAFAPKVKAISNRSLAFELFPFSSPPFAPSEQQRLHGLCPVRFTHVYGWDPGCPRL